MKLNIAHFIDLPTMFIWLTKRQKYILSFTYFYVMKAIYLTPNIAHLTTYFYIELIASV